MKIKKSSSALSSVKRKKRRSLSRRELFLWIYLGAATLLIFVESFLLHQGSKPTRPTAAVPMAARAAPLVLCDGKIPKVWVDQETGRIRFAKDLQPRQAAKKLGESLAFDAQRRGAHLIDIPGGAYTVRLDLKKRQASFSEPLEVPEGRAKFWRMVASNLIPPNENSSHPR